MKKNIVIFGVLIIAALVALDNASAQQNFRYGNDNLRRDLEKTDRVIERARSVIGENNAAPAGEIIQVALDQAGRLLEVAISIQREAYTFRNTATVSGLATGRKLTLEAREKAWKAILVRRSAEGKIEENEKTVLNQLEKTDRLLERIQNELQPATPDQLISFFDSARESQRRAWELYYERNLKAALKLSHQAERTLKKVAEKYRQSASLRQRLQNRIAAQKQKVLRAEEMAGSCRSNEADLLLKRIRKSMTDIEQAIADNRLKKTGQLLEQNRQNLRKLAGICGPQGILESSMNRLEQEMENISGVIDPADNPEAIQALDSAREHIDKARQLCRDDDTEGCAANIKAAQMNLRKARKLAGM